MNAPGRRSTALVAASALCLATTLGPYAEISPAGNPEARIRIVATLQHVDAQAGQIRLLTGIGFALRLVRAVVGTTCRIEISGRAADIADLKPGIIVRVECIETSGHLVAVAIEAIQPAATGPEP